MRRVLVVVGVVVVVVLVWVLLRGDAGGERVEGVASAVLAPRVDDAGDARFVTPAPALQAAEVVPAGVRVDPSPAVAKDPLAFEARVVHADGEPASGCVAVLAHGDAPEWNAAADADGVVRGPGSDGAATLWVGGATLAPVAFPLTSARGRHELSLPPGELIEGRVTIDGGPPPEPFVLALVEGWDEPNGDAPWRVLQALVPPWSGRSADDLRGQVVGATGAFRFSGLPAGWSGRFRPEHPWHAEDDGDLAISAPAHGVVLELLRVPRIRFRVVSERERQPEPFAEVSATVRSDSSSNGHGFRCDIEGRAELPMLRWDPAHTLVLDLVNAAGTARRHVQLAIEDCTRDLDLGDLELSSTWTIPFRVVSSDGRPLQGAEAATECEDLVTSAPTDAEGQGLLAGVPPGCEVMCVAADRHEPVLVPLPPEPPADPLEVVLTRCGWLDLVVATVDEQPRPGLHVARWTERRIGAAESRSRFFADAQHRGVYQPFLGSKGREDRHQPDGSTLRLLRSVSELMDLGRIPLGCVAPDEAIEVALVDRSAFVVWASGPITVAPGESREELAVLAMPPRVLQVLVTDSAGAPVAGAQVGILASEGRSARSVFVGKAERTGADGRAAFAETYAPLVDVTVEGAGFVKQTFARLDASLPQHLILARGLVVTLRCRTPSGRAAPVEGVWLEDLEGKGLPCRRDPLPEPGQAEGDRTDACANWRLGELPAQPVVIEVRAGGRDFRLQHDPRQAEAILELPEYGSLHVSGLGAAAGVEGTLSLRAASIDSPETVVHDGVSHGDTLQGGKMLPVVFAGRYRVELRGSDPQTHASSTLAGPVEVEVRAGETASVTLH